MHAHTHAYLVASPAASDRAEEQHLVDTLQMHAGRYSSRAESLDLDDGEAINFRCPAIFRLRYIASIVIPSPAISPKRAT
jgi:hypothetical protein